MKSLFTFLKQNENKLILTFLTFILTTGVGTFLSDRIQSYSSENNRKFEMHKVRLEEAKSLQREMLETMNIRLFWLEQIFIKVAGSDNSNKEMALEWPSSYINAKNKWNTNMIYWHSKLDVLFGETLASELVRQDENQVTIHDRVIDKLKYKSAHPKTVHSAFADAHATVNYLLTKCQTKEFCEEWNELVKQANEQIVYLKTLSNCFAHHLSGRLLIDPYGPEQAFVLPKGCHFE